MKVYVNYYGEFDVKSKKDLEKQLNNKTNCSEPLGLCFDTKTGKQIRGIDFSNRKEININWGNFDWIEVSLL